MGAANGVRGRPGSLPGGRGRRLLAGFGRFLLLSAMAAGGPYAPEVFCHMLDERRRLKEQRRLERQLERRPARPRYVDEPNVPRLDMSPSVAELELWFRLSDD